jgi:hypothetical protein
LWVCPLVTLWVVPLVWTVSGGQVQACTHRLDRWDRLDKRDRLDRFRVDRLDSQLERTEDK